MTTQAQRQSTRQFNPDEWVGPDDTPDEEYINPETVKCVNYNECNIMGKSICPHNSLCIDTEGQLNSVPKTTWLLLQAPIDVAVMTDTSRLLSILVTSVQISMSVPSKLPTFVRRWPAVRILLEEGCPLLISFQITNLDIQLNSYECQCNMGYTLDEYIIPSTSVNNNVNNEQQGATTYQDYGELPLELENELGTGGDSEEELPAELEAHLGIGWTL